MGALVRSGTGLRTERRITHVCHLTVPESERVLMITDGAVNVRPSVDTKMQIILNSVDLAHTLGNREPRVALLSATEKPTSKMRSNIHAAELLKRAKEELGRPAFVFGPLAFDIAISPEAARIKGINHPVPGNADIVVVPDIDSGNALLKMMVYFRSACAAGIVLGAKVPIILPGRADSPEASLASGIIYESDQTRLTPATLVTIFPLLNGGDHGSQGTWKTLSYRPFSGRGYANVPRRCHRRTVVYRAALA